MLSRIKALFTLSGTSTLPIGNARILKDIGLSEDQLPVSNYMEFDRERDLSQKNQPRCWY